MTTILVVDSVQQTSQSAKEAFYGVGPASQPSLVAALVTTASVTTGFGFSTTTQANALIAAVNSILATMKTLGLMATT